MDLFYAFIQEIYIFLGRVADVKEQLAHVAFSD